MNYVHACVCVCVCVSMQAEEGCLMEGDASFTAAVAETEAFTG